MRVGYGEEEKRREEKGRDSFIYWVVTNRNELWSCCCGVGEDEVGSKIAEVFL